MRVVGEVDAASDAGIILVTSTSATTSARAAACEETLSRQPRPPAKPIAAKVSTDHAAEEPHGEAFQAVKQGATIP